MAVPRLAAPAEAYLKIIFNETETKIANMSEITIPNPVADVTRELLLSVCKSREPGAWRCVLELKDGRHLVG